MESSQKSQRLGKKSQPLGKKSQHVGFLGKSFGDFITVDVTRLVESLRIVI